MSLLRRSSASMTLWNVGLQLARGFAADDAFLHRHAEVALLDQPCGAGLDGVFEAEDVPHEDVVNFETGGGVKEGIIEGVRTALEALTKPKT